jgi:sterol desaturase/sphingolipid hydroxylase (fatty acid hydroxylase superfamily)
MWEFLFPAQRGVSVLSSRRFGNITLFPLSMIISALMKPQLLALLPLMYVNFEHGLLAPLAPHREMYWALSFLLLDLSMYLQHRLLHAHQLFWSFHALHHSDSAVDFTTYFRHHPLETLVSGVMTLVIAVILGATPIMLAAYLLVNNAMQLFQHSNIRLPLQLQWIALFFVTPAFHAQHHLIERKVSDTNFSTVLTVWDKIFKTYSKSDMKPKQFGMSGFEDEGAQSIGTMLIMPLLVYGKKKVGNE